MKIFSHKNIYRMKIKKIKNNRVFSSSLRPLGGFFPLSLVSLGGIYPILEGFRPELGDVWVNMILVHACTLNRIRTYSYSVSRLSPRVEPGRASIHHTYVPRLGGGANRITDVI